MIRPDSWGAIAAMELVLVAAYTAAADQLGLIGSSSDQLAIVIVCLSVAFPMLLHVFRFRVFIGPEALKRTRVYGWGTRRIPWPSIRSWAITETNQFELDLLSGRRVKLCSTHNEGLQDLHWTMSDLGIPLRGDLEGDGPADGQMVVVTRLRESAGAEEPAKRRG